MATRRERRRGGDSVGPAAVRQGAARRGARSPAAATVSPAPPDRGVFYRRGVLAGAVAGVAYGAWKAPFAWAGNGVAGNIGNIAGHALIFAFLALGACWIWLRQQER